MAHLRQQVYELMQAALGQPEISKVRDGELYRWTLARPYDVNMYVTLDSPEHTDLAHIMVSDSIKYQPKPIVSTIVYSIDEARRLLDRIVMQWQTAGT